MQYGYGINPNMVKHHTTVLLKNEVIKKSEKKGFELTKEGVFIVEDIMSKIH